jgi:membrane protease subunit (stomatin/prohibitin family)
MGLFGMGGMGMGMGMGSPLLTGLMGGGLGYLLGSNSANQQANQQVQQVAPTYQQPQAAPPSADNLAQLKLLGELHDSGVLTDEEFTREKNRILNR